MKKLLCLLSICMLALPAFAHDPHDHGGMDAEELGTVHFPVSCAASVQTGFERGVALLHSFGYEEASKQFENIARQDPTCAMAHWGIAMSSWHQLWNRPDDVTIKAGQSELKKAEALRAKTERERDYIAAIGRFFSPAKADYETRAAAYSQAMEKMYEQYPQDREAAAFYALSLLASEPDRDTTFVNRKKAAAVLEPLLTSEPDHPGIAHYLIHAYDKPQLAQQGLPAARTYAKIAPASAHAVHMPSHIFARLGLWQDDIESNLQSVRISQKDAEMHLGGSGHQFHAMEFLMYAYLQSGREADARKIMDEVNAMPNMGDAMQVGFDPTVYAKADFPALYTLELRQWDQAAALKPEAGANDEINATTYYARALGAARSGKLGQAAQDVTKLESLEKSAASQKKSGLAEAIGQELKTAQAWIDHREGKDEAARAALRAVAEKQEAIGSETGNLPVREMLADMLLEMKHPEQALTEYEIDLKFNPNRFNALYGAAYAAEMAGKTEQANSYYAQLVKVCDGSNSERPELQHARQLLAKK
jgi:tetratricopeptide (TPR) repeat protein